MFRSARWYTRNGHVVEYDWNEKGGYDGLERALKLIDRAQAHESGRLQGMLCPAQIDTCSADLLRDSRAEAKRRGIGWQTHAAQSLPEFHEITRRHGLTPVQWLHSLGVLDPASIVGHGISSTTIPIPTGAPPPICPSWPRRAPAWLTAPRCSCGAAWRCAISAAIAAPASIWA